MTTQFYQTATLSLYGWIIEVMISAPSCGSACANCAYGDVESSRQLQVLPLSQHIADPCLEFLLFILGPTSVWMTILTRQLFLVLMCVCYSCSELSWLPAYAYFWCVGRHLLHPLSCTFGTIHTISMSYLTGSVSPRRFSGWGKLLVFS